MDLRRFASCVAILSCSFVSGSILSGRALAQAPLVNGLGGTAGYGTQCLGMNDDGSSNAINITPFFPGGLRFFGSTHSSLYVNTNGNITFSGPVPTYTPNAFPVAARPMIAPFWADVDTRTSSGSGIFRYCNGPDDGEAVMGPACDNPSQNGIWWFFEAAAGGRPARAIFTWDRVGYYQCRTDRRMSFQLILTSVTGCGSSGSGTDFDVEFRFNRCEWETGDASGGSGGFGGTPAQSGFDAGDGMNFVEIASSRTAGVANRLCTMSNVGEPGVWRFQIREGAVMCPEAGMPCSTGLSGICADGRISCECSEASCTTSCVAQVAPREERCNALDDDCDGMADEMGDAPLCGATEMCDRGRCVDRCFEGGCPEGYSCTDVGCVEAACVGVECPEGQRCRGGACIPACDGVTCPAGLTCVGGACVDTCAGITCDECTTCSGGSCMARCDLGGSCASGETCDTSSGRCVASACVGVTCGAGTFCRAGACVDACEGATCPEGEICSMGECVPAPAVDGGVPMRPDAAGVDAGPIVQADSGPAPLDAGALDGGRRAPPRGTGDGCCTVAAGADRERHDGALALSILVLGLVIARTRRRR